jgi:hypothetical protein
MFVFEHVCRWFLREIKKPSILSWIPRSSNKPFSPWRFCVSENEAKQASHDHEADKVAGPNLRHPGLPAVKRWLFQISNFRLEISEAKGRDGARAAVEICDRSITESLEQGR